MSENFHFYCICMCVLCVCARFLSLPYSHSDTISFHSFAHQIFRLFAICSLYFFPSLLYAIFHLLPFFICTLINASISYLNHMVVRIFKEIEFCPVLPLRYVLQQQQRNLYLKPLFPSNILLIYDWNKSACVSICLIYTHTRANSKFVLHTRNAYCWMIS